MVIRTLILDDKIDCRELFSEILEEEGHKVHCVKNLTEARDQLGRHDFHLAVIDILLENGEEGLELLEDISDINQGNSFCGPLVFTNYASKERAIDALQQGAFDFREKPEDFIVSKLGIENRGFVDQELKTAARKIIKQVLFERNRKYNQRKYTLSFHLIPNNKTKAELTGPIGLSTTSTNLLEIDIDNFSNRADDLQFHFGSSDEEKRLMWRSRAKDIKESLHKHIFANDAELNSCLSTARERSNQDPLHFVFCGSQDILRLPIELLPGEIGYLIIENPLVRRITDVKTIRNRGIDSTFFENTSPVKVLLIGSNTYPCIPGVDEEISQLENQLQSLFLSRGLECDIHTIPTEEASRKNVCAHLERCQYHIVHYAGHGFHHEKNTDESGLYFWEKPNKSGEVQPLPIRVLRNLLKNSDTRFFYLSCCVGAKTVTEAKIKLSGDDFQGIMEGLVRVGIPGVLGYRWNVWDVEAKQFATAFYESLLTDLSLDIATFKARRALQEEKYYNETWISPVLVNQNS